MGMDFIFNPELGRQDTKSYRPVDTGAWNNMDHLVKNDTMFEKSDKNWGQIRPEAFFFAKDRLFYLEPTSSKNKVNDLHKTWFLDKNSTKDFHCFFTDYNSIVDINYFDYLGNV